MWIHPNFQFKARYSRSELNSMNYSSKLIIKESAKEFNLAVQEYLGSLPSSTTVVSCDHSVSFKTITTSNDALFSCLIVLGEVSA